MVNLVFSLINEENKAAAVNGCYRIGLFSIYKEDYDELRTWFPEIWKKIEMLKKVYYDPINKIVFDENEISSTDGLIEYDIKLCFCADWKATAIVKGYYAANSRWPCLYCTVDKNGKNCLNEKGNPRNKEEHNLIVNMNMRENDEHKGYKRKPLIDLPEESYNIEPLHQFLRVSDVLINSLFEELLKSDGFDRDKKFKPNKHVNLKKLSDFLTENLKFKGFLDDSTQSEMLNVLKSMQGPKKKLFFEMIDFSLFFPNIIRADPRANKYTNVSPDIEQIFKKYWEIHGIIRETKVYSKQYIEQKAFELMESFLKVFHKSQVTPYLHVTCYHLADQYEALHGNIHLYSTSGLEKLNDFTTSGYFRVTNRKSGIQQLLQRDQRLDIYRRKNLYFIENIEKTRVYVKKN